MRDRNKNKSIEFHDDFIRYSDNKMTGEEMNLLKGSFRKILLQKKLQKVLLR